MTKRELLNKAVLDLMDIASDPRPIVTYINYWAKDKSTLGKSIESMPDNKMPLLFDIIKRSKYRENPNPIWKKLNEDLKEATDD